jgi:hypothetical protein
LRTWAAARPAATELRLKFVHRELAIVVLVQFLERRGGFRQFVSVHPTVVVEVKRSDDGRDRRAFAARSGASRFLGGGGPDGNAEHQCEHMSVHKLVALTVGFVLGEDAAKARKSTSPVFADTRKNDSRPADSWLFASMRDCGQ